MGPENDPKFVEDFENSILTNDRSQAYRELLLPAESLQIDQEAAWNKIDAATAKPAGKQVYLHASRIAAAVTVLLAAAVLFYYLSAGDQATVYASGPETRSLQLEDGTRVDLNRNSTLTLPADFGEHKRTLELEGEALFTVTRKPDKAPFTIRTGKGFVTVLGTVFNVKTGAEKTEVYVKEGLVSIAPSETENKTMLAQGETGIITETSADKSRKNQNALYWQTGMLSFSNATLAEICQEVSLKLNSQLVADPAVADCRLTLNFRARNIKEFVNNLAKIKPVTVKRSGDKYTLAGTSCR